jgi:hypothetical protein
MWDGLVFCEKHVAVCSEKHVAVCSHFSTAIAEAIGIVAFAAVACRSFCLDFWFF